MRKSLRRYEGFTLLEVLVVMSIVIILGGLGLYAFGGLRDTLLVNQSFVDIEQNVLQIKQDAMLTQKDADEGWVYGIGIDFRNVDEDGKYSYFKWCSGFDEFGNPKTRSEIPGYDGESALTSDNGYLPVSNTLNDCTGSIPGIAPYSGVETGTLLAGYDTYMSTASMVLFESSTGRVFLYNDNGEPMNYNVDGDFVENNLFVIVIKKNQGKLMDSLAIAPLSGKVIRSTDSEILDPEEAMILREQADTTPEQQLETMPGDDGIDTDDLETVVIDDTDLTIETPEKDPIVLPDEGDRFISIDDGGTSHLEPIYESEF